MRKGRPLDPRDQLDFEPTQPPAVADGVALAFGPQGVEEVCASLVDTDSMSFEWSWRISEKNGSIQAMPTHHPEGGFPAAMATIVQLTHVPDEQIVARKLDPCRWAFAWRIDERRVAVAEAKYRTPRHEQSEDDSALMRLICNTGIRAGRFESAEAVNDDSSKPWADADLHSPSDGSADEALARVAAPTVPGALAAPALVAMQSSGVPFVQPAHGSRAASPVPRKPPRALASSAASKSEQPRWTYRMLALSVLSVYLGTAALVALSLRDTARMEAETLKLQARADATMVQRVGDTLASGDYGEVQHELDRLALLKHFNGAVVTNARGRAVAMAGEVRDVRMGDQLQPEVAATARALPLPVVGGAAQLVVWDVEPTQANRALGGSSPLVVGLAVCGMATVAAVAMVRRQRRADRQPA